jgi:predicted house-cleaning NTP pyrophosphatase (Maf/HAM1 superfamily)
VRVVEGSLSNVVGLPMEMLTKALGWMAAIQT